MYLLPALTNGIQGFFRGIGDLKITLISSFINMALRVLAAAPLVFIWKWESKHCHIPIWLAGSECWLQKHHYF